MKIAIFIALIAVLLVLVYIAVILKKNAVNQVSVADLKSFVVNSGNQVADQVKQVINTPSNKTGISNYVS